MEGFFVESESFSEVDGTEIFRAKAEMKAVKATFTGVFCPSVTWEYFTTIYIRII